MKTYELYEEAQEADISVIALNIPQNGSMSIQSGKRCYIGIDQGVITTNASERVHLAHELGHCKTGAFYNRWATCDIRQKHENRADKWAIKKLIPKDELDAAVADGYTEMWELAEYFGVTEGFMRKAAHWYTYGNFAVE